MDRPVYSLVIPVLDEEETLPELEKRAAHVMDRLDGPSETILVDDGSRDRSYEMMLEMGRRDPRFKVVRLSRNFGHQMAITAGMDFASGDAVIIMDADLQDPPETVLEMAKLWREGYEVVYGVREQRLGETWFKRATASAFYSILQKLTDLRIPADAGDFRLVDRKALDAFRSLREHSRYIRGLFTWIGFKQTGLRYKRAERFAGCTKYPLNKMVKLATDGIVSFSVAPLRMALNCGFVIAGMSILAGTAAIVLKLAGRHVVPGWASLIVVTFFLGGVQLIVLGTLGEYIGRIYEEVRGRPLYIVREAYGIGPDLLEAHATVRNSAPSVSPRNDSGDPSVHRGEHSGQDNE
ncbi:MAG: glycosyltransferase family 2 protein [Armatimonadota bacterium]|nr:glycosyltransferase family 2 protein [Armatimonadota bacterium]